MTASKTRFFSIIILFLSSMCFMVSCTPPIDLSGNWIWTEEQLEIISGDCWQIGDTESYSMTLTQEGNLVTFDILDVDDHISGIIVGNTVTAFGTIELEEGIIFDRISLTFTADGLNMSGNLSQASDSNSLCTGSFGISATKILN